MLSPFFFVCVFVFFQIFVVGISQRLCGKSGFGRFCCWPIVCRIEGKGVVVFVFFLSFFLCCGVEWGGGYLMVTQRQSLVSVFGQFVISSYFVFACRFIFFRCLAGCVARLLFPLRLAIVVPEKLETKEHARNETNVKTENKRRSSVVRWLRLVARA